MDDQTRQEVADEATPETPAEQTEQRTDDYEGLARRLDDVLSKLDGLSSKLDGLEAMYSTFVDAGAIVSDATSAIAEAAAEGVADALEASIDLEDFDYSL